MNINSSNFNTTITSLSSSLSKSTVAPESTALSSEQIASVQLSIESLSAELERKPVLNPDLDLPKFAVFQGNNYGLIMPESEKTDRMQAQLDRLSSSAGKGLVDSGLLESEKFLEFAEGLTDQELADFAKVSTAIQTPGKFENYRFDGSPKDKAEAFMNNLSKMGSELRSEVLAKAAELSHGVPLKDNSATYSVKGLLDTGSIKANDIHNFLNAINQLTGNAEAQGSFMQGLASYQEEQQSNILSVAAHSADHALRLMDSLQQFEKDVQDETLDYLAQVIAKKSSFDIVPQKATDPENWSGAILGYDNHAPTVVAGLVEDITSLSENYRFNNEQWQTMMGELSGLDAAAQRSYVAITKTGLDTLFDGSKDKPQDLQAQGHAMETISRLRDNAVIQDIVLKSRVGEERISGGRSYFAHKDPADSERDQQAMVSFLVTDAWLNREDEARTSLIASKFNSLSAEQRDEQVAKINALAGDSEKPLALQSDLQNREDYSEFLQRSDVMRYSNDIAAVAALDESLEGVQNEQFWSLAPLMEQSVDSFVATLAAAPEPQQIMILEYLDSIQKQQLQDEENGLETMSKEQLQSTLVDFVEQFAKAQPNN
ncbi:hypothetical protein [uncultured Pseudoteredinibacter sp.]|uniref:hypothetical protein n=1 Tax=uncultured Pseudoteredinibacter sp. TaxID=1641701 RepID=UPI002619EE7B|nr:hypothetical protein [uncultured Pseudoteredinibacter sp.]